MPYPYRSNTFGDILQGLSSGIQTGVGLGLAMRQAQEAQLRTQMAQEEMKLRQQQAGQIALANKFDTLEKLKYMPFDQAKPIYEDMFKTWNISPAEQQGILKAHQKGEESLIEVGREMLGPNATDDQIRAFFTVVPMQQRGAVLGDFYKQRQQKQQYEGYQALGSPQLSPSTQGLELLNYTPYRPDAGILNNVPQSISPQVTSVPAQPTVPAPPLSLKDQLAAAEADYEQRNKFIATRMIPGTQGMAAAERDLDNRRARIESLRRQVHQQATPFRTETTKDEQGNQYMVGFNEQGEQVFKTLYGKSVPPSQENVHFASVTDAQGNVTVTGLDKTGRVVFQRGIGRGARSASEFNRNIALRSQGKDVKDTEVQSLTPAQATEIRRTLNPINQLIGNLLGGEDGGTPPPAIPSASGGPAGSAQPKKARKLDMNSQADVEIAKRFLQAAMQTLKNNNPRDPKVRQKATELGKAQGYLFE